MLKSIIIIVLNITLLPAGIAKAQGSEINIKFSKGDNISGELLYADEDSVYISTIKDAGEYDLIKGKADIRIFPNDTIASITIIGRSYILMDASLGFVIGLTAGILIGFSSGDDEPGILSFNAGTKAGILGCTGGLFGGLIGLIVGIAGSESDSEFKKSGFKDFSKLIKYSRYKIKPDYL